VRLLFVSEPGGQGDPGNADFGSDLAGIVSGFPEATPQGINDILRVHTIFIPASYSSNNQFFLTENLGKPVCGSCLFIEAPECSEICS
jgi:hypothetical protein